MDTFKFDYGYLGLLLFAVFWAYGYQVSKKNPGGKYLNYWKYVGFSPIIFYSLIEGLRYARGVDYFTYKDIYLQSKTTVNVTGQPLFDWLNYCLNLAGIPYPGSFVVYSFVTIVCFFYFLRNHRKIANYAFPLFLIATLPISETFVRQFLSLAFVFVAITFILRKDWKKFILFAVIAVLIHSASIVIVGVVALLNFIKKPINVYVGIAVYIFLTWVFDMNNISLLKPYIAALNIGDNIRFQGYVENSDSWFSQDAINSIYKQSIPAKILNTLFDISIIWMGSQFIKLNKDKSTDLIMFYNIFLIGAWLFQAFFMIEIMRRFGIVMYLFWFIIVAYVLHHFSVNRKLSISQKSCITIIAMYIVALTIRQYFLADNQLFIWDL